LPGKDESFVAGWISLGPGAVIGEDEIIAVLDWTRAKRSPENRQMVSYARAHRFLVEWGDSPQALVITKEKLFLTTVTAATLKKRLRSNIVSPSGEGMLR